MSRYIKTFNTESEYNAYSGGSEFLSPNISYIKGTDKTKYDENEIRSYEVEKFRVVADEVDYSDGVTSSVIAENFKMNFVFKEIVIPNGVTQLEMAFENYDSLEKITLPNTLTKFKYDRTFYYCTHLRELIVPNGVTEIPYRFVCLCVRLEKLELGNNITNIGQEAFAELNSLGSITFHQTVPPTIRSNSFSDSSFIIYVPSESVETYKTATNWSAYADRIQPIPNE